MYNAQQTAEKIKFQAKSKNILIKNMLEDCGLNKNALSSMLSRGSWLQANNLARIADYLDCSVDYLLGRTDNPEVNK
ncbi:XRE family transcriptional regulator [Anaerotruncus sp. 1XD22-93]|nr:XRE family transcriptional regulator [Lachnospiraceae bacterium]NBI76764.1 XRE family transcriptional regulator [Lachnospiraceae bacterium]RKJ78926.1 XRE family transcriptional regulator [Anaerotruncus sp. 1XD22-93]